MSSNPVEVECPLLISIQTRTNEADQARFTSTNGAVRSRSELVKGILDFESVHGSPRQLPPIRVGSTAESFKVSRDQFRRKSILNAPGQSLVADLERESAAHLEVRPLSIVEDEVPGGITLQRGQECESFLSCRQSSDLNPSLCRPLQERAKPSCGVLCKNLDRGEVLQLIAEPQGTFHA